MHLSRVCSNVYEFVKEKNIFAMGFVTMVRASEVRAQRPTSHTLLIKMLKRRLCFVLVKLYVLAIELNL